MDIVTFIYTNYKGITAQRVVRPIRLWFGSTAWYPEAQWLLESFCLDKQATRDFGMKGIHSSTWKMATQEEIDRAAVGMRAG